MVMSDLKRLDVPLPAKRLGEAFQVSGYELYLVGGYVRDALISGSSSGLEVDATTGAHPKEIKKLLRPRADHLWDRW